MKWFSNRYAYPVVAVVILAGTLLQFVWLNQLFKTQQRQTMREIEQVVSNASITAMYLNILPADKTNSGYRQFFLSSQWLNLKQGFDDITDQEPDHHLSSAFTFITHPDSAIVNIRLTVLKDSAIRFKPFKYARQTENSENSEDAQKRYRHLAEQMDRTVHSQLKKAGLDISAYYALYSYTNGAGDVVKTNSARPVESPAFQSRKYTYSLTGKNKYQLVVPQVNGLIIYQMRYYIFSSCFMILLTGLVFYFILQLILNQRLYSQALSSFTSNISHELKTPLSIIDVALESITRFELAIQPEKLMNYINISRAELQRLNLMIEKILNLEEMDNGKLRLRPELYDIQEGLQQVISSMQIQNQKAVIEYKSPAEPCFVNGDPVHLTNVFYNLIDNAIKYSGNDVRLLITCSCTTNDVVLSFKDHGLGIESIYHEKIFDRFFRVKSEGDIHNVKGNGLGLHYVKQIIEKHQGTITVRSEVNKGSAFTVHIPVYHEM